jgi:NitT/TauT family transport system ATP-binding protein
LALDEPVVAIDHITRVHIYETLLDVVQDNHAGKQPSTVLMVSHDPEELLLLCDEILVVSQRPSTIKDRIAVPFARPRRGDLKFTPEFVELKRTLWQRLS